MKYFAVEHQYEQEVHNYLLIDHREYYFLPVMRHAATTLFRNTLSDEDFLVLRLKYSIIVPTLTQLKHLESIHKLDLNLDELQE